MRKVWPGDNGWTCDALRPDRCSPSTGSETMHGIDREHSAFPHLPDSPRCIAFKSHLLGPRSVSSTRRELQNPCSKPDHLGCRLLNGGHKQVANSSRASPRSFRDLRCVWSCCAQAAKHMGRFPNVRASVAVVKLNASAKVDLLLLPSASRRYCL